MNTIIIPAAGDNLRWGRNYPKQLAQIGHESIIQRLVRQCHEVHTTPLVLAHDDSLIAHLPIETTILNPARHRWLTETLISSQTHWSGRVIILLGDVIFHPRLFNWIMTDGSPLRFYGTVHEIFALAFDRTFYGRVSRGLHETLTYAEHHPEDGGAGKLWSLYKALTGLPQAPETQLINRYFTFVKDEYTTDIDTTNQYKLFMQEIVHEGLLGEAGV